MWTSTVPDTHKFPTDARIRIAPHPMHGNGRICEHSPHMCGSAYITDAKDVQIAIANVCMTRARGFGRQTPEAGFRFVAGVKVKMIYIYIYLYTFCHFQSHTYTAWCLEFVPAAFCYQSCPTQIKIRMFKITSDVRN